MAGRISRELAVAAALAFALLAALAIGLAEREQAEARGGGPQLHRVGGFVAPVFVADAPGQPKLLFVVEQPGTVRVVRKGKTLKQPFVKLNSVVKYGGEQGLLSIAFDPGYARNRRFYVYYVGNDGNIHVDALKRKRASATRADANSRRKVIEVKHPVNENHNGGQLQFGPDGFLYLGTGDGGSGGDPNGNAQNPKKLLGKLLRIAPGKKGGYATPGSNPFKGGPGKAEIYSLGLRNPYRFSFDSQTGGLWIADVGQDKWEEIDHVGLGGARGANFGWDLFEGDHVFDGDGNAPANYRPPVHEYSSAGNGNCSVTGGYVARDPALPSLAGRYLYADFCRGEIRSLDAGAQNPSATDAPTGISVDQPSGFGEGVGGKLYVTSLAGAVYRIGQ